MVKKSGRTGLFIYIYIFFFWGGGGCLNFPGGVETICNIEGQYNQNPAQLCSSILP